MERYRTLSLNIILSKNKEQWKEATLVLRWAVPPRCLCLISRSPVGGTIWGYGTFRMWNLAGWMCPCDLILKCVLHFLFVNTSSCFLFLPSCLSLGYYIISTVTDRFSCLEARINPSFLVLFWPNIFYNSDISIQSTTSDRNL